MENKKKFLQSSILYFMAMILPKVVGFIILPVYTRYIDPEGFGIFSLTGSVVGFMAVLSSMGLNAFYLRNYSSSKNTKEFNGTIFWSMAIWNVLLFMASLIIIPIILNRFGSSVPFSPYMFLAILTQLFNSMEIIPMRTFRIRGEVRNYFVRILLKTVFSVIFGLVFVVGLEMGLLGRYYAELLNAFIFAIVFMVYMSRNSYFKINKKLLKEALRFSLPILPADLLQMSTPMIINIIIEQTLSLAQLGIYSIGVMISSIVQLVTTSISLTVEPELYKKAGSSDFPIFLIKLKNITILLVGIICVGAGLFIREISIILLAEKYWDSWRIVQIISLSYIVLVLKNQYSQLAIIQGRTRALISGNIGYLLMSALVCLVALPIWGENALGWSNIIGTLSAFLILYLSVDRKEYTEMKLSRDFFMITFSVLTLYFSRFSHEYSMLISICIKAIIFIIYCMILLRIYNVRFEQVIDLFNRKRTEGP